VVGFFLPPLRERRQAIVPLAARFLVQFASRGGCAVGQIAADALRALEGYAWPGNIRELRNVLERAVALCPDGEIQLRDLPEAVRAAAAAPAAVTAGRPAPRAETLAALAAARDEAEIVRIAHALEKHGHDRRRAAAALGLSRLALARKLHQYGLIGAD
jgi:DNA-binding NtrC family response regulator